MHLFQIILYNYYKKASNMFDDDLTTYWSNDKELNVTRIVEGKPYGAGIFITLGVIFITSLHLKN